LSIYQFFSIADSVDSNQLLIIDIIDIDSQYDLLTKTLPMESTLIHFI